jgi:predicted ABC-type ATPase
MIADMPTIEIVAGPNGSGKSTFADVYLMDKPICADWYVFDNSKKKPRLIQNKLNLENATPNNQAKFIASFLKGKLP